MVLCKGKKGGLLTVVIEFCFAAHITSSSALSERRCASYVMNTLQLVTRHQDREDLSTVSVRLGATAYTYPVHTTIEILAKMYMRVNTTWHDISASESC